MSVIELIFTYYIRRFIQRLKFHGSRHTPNKHQGVFEAPITQDPLSIGTIKLFAAVDTC